MKLKNIFVHCSSSPWGDVLIFDEWHKKRGWCFPLHTEVLTDKGWKDYHQFDLIQHKVAVYKKGIITFEYAHRIVFNEQQETARAVSLNADFEFSLDHSVYTSTGGKNSFKIRKWGDEIKSRKGNNVVKVAGTYQSNSDNCLYPKYIYALAAFIAADGWYYKKNGEINGIGIDTKKERKAKYIKNLLDKSKVAYTQPKKRGYYRFRICKKSVQPFINILGKFKQLSYNLLHLPLNFREFIISAYTESDGWNNTHTAKGRVKDHYSMLYSTSKQNIDVLQALVVTSGKRATLKKTENTEPTRHPKYHLSIVDKDNVTLDLRTRSISYRCQPTWDVDLGNKLLMIRHNGMVSVTHNSGVGYHYIVLNGRPYADVVYWDFLDGQIEPGRHLNDDPIFTADEVGAHVAGRNSDSIGICLVGRNTFTNKQLEAAKELLKILTAHFNLTLADVLGHYEDPNTDKTCPNIPLSAFRDFLYDTISVDSLQRCIEDQRAVNYVNLEKKNEAEWYKAWWYKAWKERNDH